MAPARHVVRPACMRAAGRSVGRPPPWVALSVWWPAVALAVAAFWPSSGAAGPVGAIRWADGTDGGAPVSPVPTGDQTATRAAAVTAEGRRRGTKSPVRRATMALVTAAQVRILLVLGTLVGTMALATAVVFRLDPGGRPRSSRAAGPPAVDLLASATATPTAVAGAATGTPVDRGGTPAAGAARTPTRPTAQPGRAVGVRAAEAVNVRAGPGTTYAVIAALLPGDAATAVGRNADASWLALDAPAGWVAAGIVDVTGDPFSLPIRPAPPLPAVAAVATAIATPAPAVGAPARTATPSPTPPTPGLTPAAPARGPGRTPSPPAATDTTPAAAPAPTSTAVTPPPTTTASPAATATAAPVASTPVRTATSTPEPSAAPAVASPPAGAGGMAAAPSPVATSRP
jgi:uncharacterized protein YraI